VYKYISVNNFTDRAIFLWINLDYQHPHVSQIVPILLPQTFIIYHIKLFNKNNMIFSLKNMMFLS